MAPATSADDVHGDAAAGPRRARRARPRRHAAGLLVVVGALAIGGAAFAWVSTSSSGTAEASTSTMSPVTVAALGDADATTSDLQPGGAADVVLRVSNPNPYAARLVAVAPNGAVTATGGVGTCTTTGVTLVAQSGLAVALPADTTTLVDLPAAATMSAASSSGCQGATFSIPVAITVHTP